jgi:hypothetical protein
VNTMREGFNVCLIAVEDEGGCREALSSA